MIKGIDVSAYQGETYSTKGISFVFIKATEGRSYINPKQEEQAKHARDAGCVVGFYHFLWPDNIKEQAAYFVEKCDSVEGDILFVDWENTQSGTRASCAEKDAFIAEVKRLRPDHKVGLYCNRDFWLNHDTTSNAGDALWIADYVSSGHPRIEAAWLFHQYTSTPIDTNVAAFDTKQALKDWAVPPTTPTPNPTPTPTPTVQYEPYPGEKWFIAGRKSPIVKAMHKRLVEVGCDKYKSEKNKDTIGSGDIASYEAWQKKYNKKHNKGWTGDALKWPPGKETWDALKVPNVPNK